MTRPKVRASVLRRRLQQLNRDDRRRASATNKDKTAAMLLKEIEYNMDIKDILTSGPLHHNAGGVDTEGICDRCLKCLFGIHPSTGSTWRKKLGLPKYEAA